MKIAKVGPMLIKVVLRTFSLLLAVVNHLPGMNGGRASIS